MIARLVARRDLVSFVRQASGVWDLALLSLVVAVFTQAYSGSICLLSLLGLAIAWEWTGKRASAVFIDPDRMSNPVRSNLALVAGLATAVGFVISAIVGWAWWTTSSEAIPIDGSPTSVVLMSALLGGVLVFQVLRQSWRIPAAAVAIVVMALAILWQVGNCWSNPVPASGGGFQIFARLVLLLATGAALDLWAYPIGYKTRWLPRLVRIGIVVPLVASMLVLVELPPASLGSEMTVRKGAWLAGLLVGLVSLTAIFTAGVVRRTRLVSLVRDRFKPQPWKGPISPGMIEILTALPPLFLIVSANNITWLGTMAVFVVARLAIALSHKDRPAWVDMPKPNHLPASSSLSSPPQPTNSPPMASEDSLMTG
jgi:hypothetical protein